MLLWLKKHQSIIISLLVTVGICIYLTACEPKVKSLNKVNHLVTRAELQVEFDNIIDKFELRMIALDKQERLRELIMQNALLIAQGQPFNPVGILTGLAAIYGAIQGGTNVSKRVKLRYKKGKADNGTG